MAVTLSTPVLSDELPLRYCLVPTDLGPLAMLAQGPIVVRLIPPGASYEGLKALLGRSYPAVVESPDLLAGPQRQLQAYCRGELEWEDLEAVVDVSWASGFQKSVLSALLAVGSGSTCTYGELAARAGRPGAARAAGQAMARNRTPLLIPCHRVVPSTGGIGNYSGPDPMIKARLLARERATLRGGEIT